MVKQFYDRLFVNDGVICSTVDRHRIRISSERFNTLFDLHPTPDHVKIYCAQRWTSLVDEDKYCRCCFVGRGWDR